MGGAIRVDDLTIAISAQTSTILKLDQDKMVTGVITPSAFTSISISFEAGIDINSMIPLHNENGVLIAVPIAASRHSILDPSDFVGIRFIRILSASAEAAERTLQIVTTPRT